VKKNLVVLIVIAFLFSCANPYNESDSSDDDNSAEDTTPPGEVTAVKSEIGVSSVTLNWVDPSDEDL
jgi:hypothetical protein